MSKIEGNDSSVSRLQTPNYDFNPEQTAAASVIKVFNLIRDSYDTQPNSGDFPHQINTDCCDFTGLCEYLLGSSPKQQAEKSSIESGDIIDLLLSHMSSPTKASAEKCLIALHKFKTILPNSEVIGKIEATFQKNRIS